MTEYLIDCIRENEVLYDQSHPKYMDTRYKNAIWEKIAEEMHMDAAACKIRWNNIRDTYRKSLKKCLKRSGQGAKNIKTYIYAEQLDFLKNQFDEKITKSDIKNQEDQDDRGELDQKDLILEVNPEDLGSQSSSRVRKSKRPKTKSSLSQQIIAEKLPNKLINNEYQATHPVDAFLAGIAPTLKTFSPYHLHLAKSEIFAAVQKYELITIEDVAVT